MYCFIIDFVNNDHQSRDTSDRIQGQGITPRAPVSFTYLTPGHRVALHLINGPLLVGYQDFKPVTAYLSQ